MRTDTLRSRIFTPQVRRVRVDALPEHSTYVDDGCEVAPHCLECPLPKCRYEYKQGLLTLRTQARVSRVIELRGLGYTTGAIASAMETSRRAVSRMLAAARRLEGDTSLLKVGTNGGIMVLMGESSYDRA